jgi:hypothetical protein
MSHMGFKPSKPMPTLLAWLGSFTATLKEDVAKSFVTSMPLCEHSMPQAEDHVGTTDVLLQKAWTGHIYKCNDDVPEVDTKNINAYTYREIACSTIGRPPTLAAAPQAMRPQHTIYRESNVTGTTCQCTATYLGRQVYNCADDVHDANQQHIYTNTYKDHSLTGTTGQPPTLAADPRTPSSSAAPPAMKPQLGRSRPLQQQQPQLPPPHCTAAAAAV